MTRNDKRIEVQINNIISLEKSHKHTYICTRKEFEFKTDL